MFTLRGKQQKIVADIRKRLLRELADEVEERFGGNKAKAAIALEMHRVPFTNLCNGREAATLDKLIQIGAKLGWEIELRVKRGTGDVK
jgi:hypothetical protein